MTIEDARALVDGWIAGGKRVMGPRTVKPGLIQYGWLASGGELELSGFIRPANSIKEAVFPRHEVLYRYRVDGNRIELEEDEFTAPETIVFGARPCDAAALPILDKVFNWDFADEFFNRRRAATTVITLECGVKKDECCFCDAVGLGPRADRGSDAMLAGDGPYEVRSFSEKGVALFGGAIAERSAPGEAKIAPAPFSETAEMMRCLGCGACAYTCPTCHCFDIIDEHAARVRNWDACQFGMFTMHASGHNPRATQPQRQRQRIYHKFTMYPEKFGEILCTGCGNCARNCPVDLGVLNVLKAAEYA